MLDDDGVVGAGCVECELVQLVQLLEALTSAELGAGGRCGGWTVAADGRLNEVRIPLVGYSGYYRPAMRTQSRWLSLLLYQIPASKEEVNEKLITISRREALEYSKTFRSLVHSSRVR